MPNRITNRGSGKTVVNKVSQVPFCYHPTRLLTVILSEHVRTLFKHTFLQFTPGTHIKILLFWRELTGKRKISRPQTLQNTGSSSDGLKDVFLGGSQAGYKAFTRDTWQGSCVVVLRERKKGKGFKPQNRTCVENIFFHVARDHLGMASCSVHLGKLRNAHSSRSCGEKKKQAVHITLNGKLANHKVTWQPLLNHSSSEWVSTKCATLKDAQTKVAATVTVEHRTRHKIRSRK